MTTPCAFVIAAAVMVFSIAPAVFSAEQNAAGVTPSPAESVAARVDKLFAEWNRSDSPGCSLAVSRNGVVVYEHGYGMANLEAGLAITPASVFHVASISKQFTAMSILLLAERGQLSLDDDVRKHITELPDYGTGLTIRHLLSHTSGLRDAFTLLGLAAPREDDTDRNEAAVRMLARQRALNFRPGTEFQYNNGGYVLLATIVKRVSGQSLRAFTDANIFKPLGMTLTHVHDDATMIVPNRAAGYHEEGGTFHVAVHGDLGHIVGTTGLFTTARDLLLWEQNFAEARVGSRALLTAMQTPVIPTGWPDGSSYGLGLEIGQYRGLRTIGHGGGDPGYGAYVVRYPDQGIAIAVLGNLDNIGSVVGQLTQGVADIYLADAFAAPPSSNAPVTLPKVVLSADELAGKAGLYRDPASETIGRIFVRDGKLMAREGVGEGESVELTAVSANRFVVRGTTIVAEFVPGVGGRAREIKVSGTGPKPIVSELLPPFAPSGAELRAFAGDYTSAELEVAYTLNVRDPGLVIQMPGRGEVILQPIFADAFAGAGVNVVKFSRDTRGGVTGFTVNTSGVRGLRFDRVKP